MSSRNKKQNRQNSNPPAAHSLTPEHHPREEFRREIEVRWAKLAVVVSIVALLLSPVINAVTTQIFNDWSRPNLVYKSTEIILVNGRVLDASVTNAGKSPAKNVVVTFDVFHPTFKLTEAHHVHTIPAVPYKQTFTGGRMSIALDNPMGQNDDVMIIIDNIEFKEGYKPMFAVGVTSDQGTAVNQGRDLQSHPELTLDQFLFPDGHSTPGKPTGPSR